MSELKYYKLSGKINFKSYLIALLIAIIASYYIGQFYHYFNGQFYQFIIEKLFKSDIERHSNEFSAVISKLLTRPRGAIILCILLVILSLPFFTTAILMSAVMIGIKGGGQSRNKIVDTIMFMPLSFICFFVSNNYVISTTGDYFELFIFFILVFLVAFGHTNYFCEKCMKNYSESTFYITSELNSDAYLADVNTKGIDKENRYEAKQILEKEDIENLYFIELNICDTCGSQIVKIESKIIEVDSNGKKKIKDGKKIIKDLIIS